MIIKFKKYLLEILFIGGICCSGFAQERIGLHLGGSIGNGYFNYPKEPIVSIQSQIGGLFGIIAEFELEDHFFIQPEFNYVQKGHTLSPVYDWSYGEIFPGSNEEQSLDYFEIPVFFKSKMNWKYLEPFIMVSPTVGLLLKAKSILNVPGRGQIFTDLKQEKILKSVNFSVDIAGGIEYKVKPGVDFFADFRFSIGLVDLNKSDEIVKKTNGFQISCGLKFDIFSSETKEKIITEKSVRKPKKKIPGLKRDTVKTETPVEEKAEKIAVTEILRDFDLSDYNIPIFVTCYYRPNLPENFDSLMVLMKDKTNKIECIENLIEGTSAFDHYKEATKRLKDIFYAIGDRLIDDVLPTFDSTSGLDEILEVRIIGYADERKILTGKFMEQIMIDFEDLNGKLYLITKGEPMNNIILSGLRAHYTGYFLDDIFFKVSEKKKGQYRKMKEEGRIKFTYIGAGVASDENKLESQRKARILFIKKTNQIQN
jgi:hypothetical protein